MYIIQLCLLFTEDTVIFADELSSVPQAVMVTPGSVEELLGGVKLLLSETLVNQVKASFQFNIHSEDGQQQSYYVDLSKGDGLYTVENVFLTEDLT